MIYARLAWREICSRPGRAALTLISIVIGVAAVVAVSFATQTTRSAFQAIYQTIAGRAALEITAPVGTSFDDTLTDTVAKVPGVKAVAPMIQRRTVIYVGERRIQLMALGIDPKRDAAVHDYKLEGGQALDKGNGVMLNLGVAESVGVKVGDPIDILTRQGLMRAPIVGLYTSQGTATTGQGAVLLMQLRAAQKLFKAPKKLDSIQIVLDEGADEAAVKAAIEKVLPQGVGIDRPVARSSMAEETSLSTEQGMRMARAFSLAVAVFIIANTFLINVTQRRRQLGIMRAVGATRQQIGGMICTEALMLGAVGTILGSVIGVLASQVLSGALGTLYKTTLPGINLSFFPFLLGAVFGMGISLLGAALPAWKASHLSPLDAMRDVLPEEIEGVTRWFVIFGSVLVVISLIMMGGSILGWMPMFHAVWWSVLLLIGISVLLPVALRPLSALVAEMLPGRYRVEARLARRQLLRHRARTMLTTGVVFVAIATGIGLANAVMDNVADVRNWYQKAIVADFFVRAMAPDMATGLAADLPDDLDPKIRKVEGLRSIDTMRLVSAKVAGQSVVVISRVFDENEDPPFDLADNELKTVLEKLHAGEVVLGSVLAQRAGLKPGDTVSLETDKGTQEFTIAAVADDYSAGGLTVYVQRDIAKKVLGVDGVDAYVIEADHDRLDEVRESLQKLCDEYGLLLQSFSDIQHTIDVMMAGVVAALWAMVVLLLLVAGFGVANTLTTTVLEQTRELGLLRIIAMNRSQVRATIIAQAVMMGLLALLPGVLAGVGVAYLINLSTLQVIGHQVSFVVHPYLMLGGLAAGLVIVTAAAWIPAERAARLELPATLRYQ